MDHKAYLSQMPTELRARLLERTDAPGLRHLALHMGLILAVGTLIAMQVPFWGLLLPVQGVLIAFLFTLQHEATHQTPFRTVWINEAVGYVTAVLLVQPFLWFRYFHLAHHRHTNDPERDPELAGDTPKPETWAAFAWHLSSLGYWRDKGIVLLQLLTDGMEADYLPASARGRVRREAFWIVGTLGLVLWVSLSVTPVLLWVWLIPLLFGFPVLRLYLLAEHGRCPTVTNMFDNTRTTYTNRIVRFLAWNMPYHTEHHVFPQVPFHNLPAFNAEIDAYLRQTSSGYGAFARDYVGGFARDGAPAGRPPAA